MIGDLQTSHVENEQERDDAEVRRVDGHDDDRRDDLRRDERDVRDLVGQPANAQLANEVCWDNERSRETHQRSTSFMSEAKRDTTRPVGVL